jgi:hypothetical protein
MAACQREMLDLILSHLSSNHLFSSRFKFIIRFVSLHMGPTYLMVNFKKIYMEMVRRIKPNISRMSA